MRRITLGRKILSATTLVLRLKLDRENEDIYSLFTFLIGSGEIILVEEREDLDSVSSLISSKSLNVVFFT